MLQDRYGGKEKRGPERAYRRKRSQVKDAVKYEGFFETQRVKGHVLGRPGGKNSEDNVRGRRLATTR